MRYTIHGVASALSQCTWAPPWNGTDSDTSMKTMTDAVADLEYVTFLRVDEISVGSFRDVNGSMMYKRDHMTSSLICLISIPQGGHPLSGSSHRNLLVVSLEGATCLY